MPDMLTRREMAATLKISVKTLRRMERDGVGPKPIRLGERIVRYPTETVAELAVIASAPAEIVAEIGHD